MKYKKFHDFLNHYLEGKTAAFEDRPIDIKTFGNIKTYETSVQKHANYYNFEDSEYTITRFLKKVGIKFKHSTETIIKCSFLLENLHLPPTGSGVSIISLRYWSTNTYKTTYFNDFLFFCLNIDLRNRVIANC